MNFVFGLIPVAGLLLILAYLRMSKIIGSKHAIGVGLFLVLITAYFSVNTYGPRVGVSSNTPPIIPERVEINSGAKMIEEIDRSGNFKDLTKEVEK